MINGDETTPEALAGLSPLARSDGRERITAFRRSACRASPVDDGRTAGASDEETIGDTFDPTAPLETRATRALEFAQTQVRG